VSLYFDSGTNLLVLVECTVRPGGKPQRSQLFLSDYKRVQGIAWPMKQVQIVGPVRIENRIKEVKFLKHVPASKFEKP
jgi:hypothetical protein